MESFQEAPKPREITFHRANAVQRHHSFDSANEIHDHVRSVLGAGGGGRGNVHVGDGAVPIHVGASEKDKDPSVDKKPVPLPRKNVACQPSPVGTTAGPSNKTPTSSPAQVRRKQILESLENNELYIFPWYPS